MLEPLSDNNNNNKKNPIDFMLDHFSEKVIKQTTLTTKFCFVQILKTFGALCLQGNVRCCGQGYGVRRNTSERVSVFLTAYFYFYGRVCVMHVELVTSHQDGNDEMEESRGIS